MAGEVDGAHQSVVVKHRKHRSNARTAAVERIAAAVDALFLVLGKEWGGGDGARGGRRRERVCLVWHQRNAVPRPVSHRRRRGVVRR